MSTTIEVTATTDPNPIPAKVLAQMAFDLCERRDHALHALAIQAAKCFHWDLAMPVSEFEPAFLRDFEAAFLRHARDLDGDIGLAAVRAMGDIVEKSAVMRFNRLKGEVRLGME